MRKLFFATLFIFAQTALYAQTDNVLLNRILRQVRLFPQEKTYVCTDADSYQAGQCIHFRVFLVNAITHQPDSLSRYVYVELLGPDRLVVKRVRLLRSDQGFAGQIDIPEGVAAGRYMLRSYTRNMLDLEGYESLKSIFIGGYGRLLPHKYACLSGPQKEKREKLLDISQSGEDIHVKLTGVSDRIQKEYWLLAHCRSVPFYYGKIYRDRETILHGDSLVQGGVCSFLLLDSNFDVVDEQLRFLFPEKEQCPVSVKWDDAHRTAEGLVPFLVEAEGLKPDETMDVSLRLERVEADNRKGSSGIFNHLLFDSDLYCFPEEPSSVLDEKDTLKELLEGNVWRRYRMGDVMKGDCRKGGNGAEISAVIRGKVETLAGHRPIKDGIVNLISPDKGFYATAKTDEKGCFSFEGMDFPEGTQYVLNAFTKTGKSWVKLLLDEDVFPPYAGAVPPFEWSGDDTVRVDATLDIPDGSIRMEEVHVFSHRPSYASRSDPYAHAADFSFGLRDIEDIGATCLHELLRRVPGVTVEFGKCYVRGGVTVGGRRPAAVAIDGIFVNEDYDLDNIQMADVERVDVFKSGSTVIWGAIGGMGVISITTKKGDFKAADVPLTNTKAFTTLGYQVPQGYTPSRRTPIWRPSLRGRSFRLLLPETFHKDYRIVIEGVTSEGRIVCFAGE